MMAHVVMGHYERAVGDAGSGEAVQMPHMSNERKQVQKSRGRGQLLRRAAD